MSQKNHTPLPTILGQTPDSVLWVANELRAEFADLDVVAKVRYVEGWGWAWSVARISTMTTLYQYGFGIGLVSHEVAQAQALDWIHLNFKNFEGAHHEG